MALTDGNGHLVLRGIPSVTDIHCSACVAAHSIGYGFHWLTQPPLINFKPLFMHPLPAAPLSEKEAKLTAYSRIHSLPAVLGAKLDVAYE